MTNGNNPSSSNPFHPENSPKLLDNRVNEFLHTLNYLELWVHPSPRQVWEKSTLPCGTNTWVSSLSRSKERRGATPSDLVLDLVYVVLLAQLGRAFRAELGNDAWLAFRDFVALFTPIWFQWNCVGHFLNRFEQKDVVFALYFVGNILTMAIVGISAERCGSATVREGCAEFSWSIAGTRAWTVLYQLYALKCNPKYWKAIAMYIVPDIMTIIAWTITGFMPAGETCGDVVNSCWGAFIFFWWLAIACDLLRFFTPMIVVRQLKLIKDRSEAISLNINLLAERHELFIIISIGEIIAASLASEGASDIDGPDDEHHRSLVGESVKWLGKHR